MASDRLRKLFKEIGRYRVARDGWRNRVRLRYLMGDPRAGFAGRLTDEWNGGYVPYGDGRIWLYIPALPDVQGRRLLIDGGRPEPALALLCRPGAVVVDIGANLGEWMAPLACTVGAEGQVFAFEPVPVLADALGRTTRINGFGNVEVVRAAVADKRGGGLMQVDMGPGGDGALSRLAGPGDSGGLTVDVLTLDDFVAERGLERLDLVKIDVEGAERRVLQGAKRTLKSLRPRLVFESGHESAEDRSAIADLLDDADFDLVGVLLDDVVIDTDWSRYRDPQGDFADGRTRNLLALPRA